MTLLCFINNLKCSLLSAVLLIKSVWFRSELKPINFLLSWLKQLLLNWLLFTLTCCSAAKTKKMWWRNKIWAQSFVRPQTKLQQCLKFNFKDNFNPYFPILGALDCNNCGEKALLTTCTNNTYFMECRPMFNQTVIRE